MLVGVEARLRIILVHKVFEALILALFVLLFLLLLLNDHFLRTLRLLHRRFVQVELRDRHHSRLLIKAKRVQIRKYDSTRHLLIRFHLDLLQSFQSFLKVLLKCGVFGFKLHRVDEV